MSNHPIIPKDNNSTRLFFASTPSAPLRALSINTLSPGADTCMKEHPAFPSSDRNRRLSPPRPIELRRFGYAHFDSLRIKEAGVGYRLGFTATGLTSVLPGGSYVESEAFTVGVGPAYRLELERDILDGSIVSGSPFKEQVGGWSTQHRNVYELLPLNR